MPGRCRCSAASRRCASAASCDRATSCCSRWRSNGSAPGAAGPRAGRASTVPPPAKVESSSPSVSVAAVKLALSGDAAADKLLSKDPLALLIGMVLDQQVPLEWAFAAPFRLKERLGGRLDATDIARMEPDALVKAVVERPALHRFPAANAKRVQEFR